MGTAQTDLEQATERVHEPLSPAQALCSQKRPKRRQHGQKSWADCLPSSENLSAPPARCAMQPVHINCAHSCDVRS